MRPLHGTESKYTNGGCRCDRCREAHRLTQKAYRDNRRETAPAPIPRAELIEDFDDVCEAQRARVRASLTDVSRRLREDRLAEVSTDPHDLTFERRR